MSLSLDEFWLQQQDYHPEGRLLYSPVQRWTNMNVGFVGLLIIISLWCCPFVSICLVKRERKHFKELRWARFYSKQTKMIDVNMPMISDNKKLVHASGLCVNGAGLLDEDFGIICENGYRIERIVQMKQWQEFTFTKSVKKGKKTKTEYYCSHTLDWYDHMINSNRFKEKDGHENPNKKFPFESYTQQAKEVMMGMIFLRPDAISQLGWKNVEEINFRHSEPERFVLANAKNEAEGFTAWEPHFTYVEAKPKYQTYEQGVGTIRVFYKIYKCKEATVVGQLIQDHKGLMTMRKYNHRMIDAPYGRRTNFEDEPEPEKGCCGRCCKWCASQNMCKENEASKCAKFWCCSCRLMRFFVGTEKLDETVFHVDDGNHTIQKYAAQEIKEERWKLFLTRFFVWLVISMNSLFILGFTLYPIISGLTTFNFFRWAGFGDWGSYFAFFFIFGFLFQLMLTGIGVFAANKLLGTIMMFLGLILLIIIGANPGGRRW